MVPVFHDLGQGGGHATGHCALARQGVVGAKAVVVSALGPGGGQEGCNGGVPGSGGQLVVEQIVPLLCGGVVAVSWLRLNRIGLELFEIAYLRLVVLKPPHYVVGHVFEREGGSGGITQNGHHAVVGRNQHETLAVGGLEHIELCERCGGGYVLERCVGGSH